jgi:hypothetical protein
MRKVGKIASIMGAMMGTILGNNTMSRGEAYKDSNDVQGNDEGRTTAPVFWGMSNPIFIPSKSQRVKSKRLALRNAKR